MLKKFKIVSILGILISITLLSACGVNPEEHVEGNVTEIIVTEKEEAEMDTEKEAVDLNKEVEESAIQEMEQEITQELEQELPMDIPMIELPEGITGIKAETEKYADLEKLLIEYFEIPEEYWELSSYYYNYVDLNEDGNDEIFVVVNGLYTSGTGGSSALWVEKADGKLRVNQDFTLVNTPIVISDKITNQVHELIIPYHGGGAENQYKILTYKEGSYTSINNGESVDTLEGITGKAIIANDLITEITNQIEGLKLTTAVSNLTLP